MSRFRWLRRLQPSVVAAIRAVAAVRLRPGVFTGGLGLALMAYVLAAEWGFRAAMAFVGGVLLLDALNTPTAPPSR